MIYYISCTSVISLIEFVFINFLLANHCRMLHMWALLNLFLLLQVGAPTTCISQISQVSQYRSSLLSFLGEQAQNEGLNTILERARGWQEHVRDSLLTDPIIKLHQAFLHLDQVQEGEMCGPRGNEYIDSLNFACEIAVSKPEDERDLIENLIMNARQNHTILCSPIDEERALQLQSEIFHWDKYLVSSMGWKNHNNEFSETYYRGNDLFQYQPNPYKFGSDLFAVVMKNPDDPDVVDILEWKIKYLDEGKLNKLYMKFAHGPCVIYIEKVGPALDAIRLARQNMGPHEYSKEVREMIHRYSLCRAVTQLAVDENYEQYLRAAEKFSGKPMKNQPKPKFEGDSLALFHLGA